MKTLFTEEERATLQEATYRERFGQPEKLRKRMLMAAGDVIGRALLLTTRAVRVPSGEFPGGKPAFLAARKKLAAAITPAVEKMLADIDAGEGQ